MKRAILVFVLALFSLGTSVPSMAAPPECKENQKNCEKITLEDFKKEIISIEIKNGGLVKKEAPLACAENGQSCTFSNDCCGKLFCVGGTAGARSCREIGG